MDIEKLQAMLREFAKERDWEQFHTPKNLMMAMTGTDAVMSRGAVLRPVVCC